MLISPVLRSSTTADRSAPPSRRRTRWRTESSWEPSSSIFPAWAANLADEVTHRQPQCHAAHDRDHELEAGVEQRERPADGSGNGDPVGDQRGRVVDQALTLDQVDDPARGAEAAHDRRRRTVASTKPTEVSDRARA